MTINLAVVRGVRELQEYFFSDGEVLPLRSSKVFFDELAVGTSKVVDGVGEVLAYVDFAVRIVDLVDNLHYLLLTRRMLCSLAFIVMLLGSIIQPVNSTPTRTMDIPKITFPDLS